MAVRRCDVDLTLSPDDDTGARARRPAAPGRKRHRSEAEDTIDLTREDCAQCTMGAAAASCRTRLQPPDARGGPLKPNTSEEDCPICLEAVPAGKGVQLSGCAHTVCGSCLEQQMASCFEEGKCFEAFACPRPECRERLSHRELRVVLGELCFGRLSQRSLDKAVLSCANLFACRATADCGGKFCWDDHGSHGRDHRPKKATCEVCLKEQCIVCGASPFHRGQTCAEAEAVRVGQGGAADKHAAAEAATRKFMSSSATIRVCVMCNVGVERREGCAKMQCRCGYRFCFECGAPGAKCSCTPAAHGFWDNKRGRADFTGLRRGSR
jgi:E3 ubiquitin-protein ligase RNF144